MSNHAIVTKHLSKRFPARARNTLSDISIELREQSCLALLGPSGCGKTTLLRLLMGLEQPTTGEIIIAGHLRERMTYVFQEPRLVPWRTVLENMLLPFELAGNQAKANIGRARELLGRVGLAEFESSFPAELSGGMQMRTSLVRALVTGPRLLLLDEPFAALDERSRFRLQDLLLELRALLGLQYVFVTHSVSEAIYLSDAVMVLNQHGECERTYPVQLGARTQPVKLTEPFTALARQLEHHFEAIEKQR